MKTCNTVANRIAQVVMPIYLMPSDFGIFALALFFSGFLSLASDLGISTDLVRRKNDVEAALDTAFVLRLVLSLALVGVSIAVGVLASFVYKEQRLQWPIVVLSVGLVLQALSLIPRTISTRALQFGRAAIPDGFGKISTSFLSIGLAVIGLAYWSPVYGTILGTAIGTALQLAVTRWTPRGTFDRKIAVEILRFGQFVSLSSLANYVAHSMDVAIVGLLLPLAQVGFYSLAVSWGIYFTSNLSSIFRPVGFPVMSHVADEDARRKKVLKENIRYYGYLGVCLSAGVAVLSRMFVLALYSSEWAPMILPMQVLSLAGLLLGFAGVATDALYSVGQSKSLAIYSWIEVLLLAIIVPIATFFGGLPGTSVAMLFGVSALTLPTCRKASEALGLKVVDWWKMTSPAIFAALVAVPVGVGLSFLLTPTPPNLAISLVFFLAVYTLGLQAWTRGEFFQDLRNMIRLALSRT